MTAETKDAIAEKKKPACPYFDYWHEALGCALDEASCYEALTDEQKNSVAKAMQNASEGMRMAFGWDEADKTVRRMNDKEAMTEVVIEVEKLCADMGEDPRILEVATHEQKLALARIFNLRDYLSRKGILTN